MNFMLHEFKFLSWTLHEMNLRLNWNSIGIELENHFKYNTNIQLDLKWKWIACAILCWKFIRIWMIECECNLEFSIRTNRIQFLKSSNWRAMTKMLHTNLKWMLLSIELDLVHGISILMVSKFHLCCVIIFFKSIDFLGSFEVHFHLFSLNLKLS